MSPLKILGLLGVCLLSTNCRKGPDTAKDEIQEAGYEMTTEGWFRAVEAGDTAVLQKMAAAGFNEQVLDSKGNNAFHIAAAKGDEALGNFLLNMGFSLDALGEGKQTPLMIAVRADRSKMVKWLLNQGADPKIKNPEGYQALTLAAVEGKAESVEELAPYHAEDLDSALLLASLVGQAEVIDTLTNYGASVYARMEDGRTALMLAAQNGHREAVALLMDIGASRFSSTEDGSTAESLAAKAGHTEIAQLIATGEIEGSLALESDDEVVAAMDEYVEEIDTELAANSADFSQASLAAGDGSAISPNAANTAQAMPSTPTSPDAQPGVPPISRAKTQPLSGATISKSAAVSTTSSTAPSGSTPPPLVMRHYRHRELPIEVREVSGGVASIRIAGPSSREVKVSAGQRIPQSNLEVIKAYTRNEIGKLNNNQPTEVGVVVVVDTSNGEQAEWISGRSAAGHQPVALVEDAVTGTRYVAKPGQTFSSEDGTEFSVSDVRPTQVIIENLQTGEMTTLKLRGPRG